MEIERWLFYIARAYLRSTKPTSYRIRNENMKEESASENEK